MHSIKLFYLEDNDYAAIGGEDLIGGINDVIGSSVAKYDIVATLADARSLLDANNGNGVSDYTHFLFDISVPYYKRLRNGKVITYGSTTGFAGLDFIVDSYTNNPLFKKALIGGYVGIISGHSIDQFKSDNRELYDGDLSIRDLSDVCNQITCFSKLSNDTYIDIQKWLMVSAK